MTIDEVMHVAVQHFMAGRLPDAEKICRQVLPQQPTHAGALHMLGLIAKQTGHIDAAVDLLRLATQAAPRNADIRNNLGVVLKEQEKNQEAVAELSEAISLDPISADAHNNLGTAFTQLGDHDERAIACFRRAIELKPNYPEAFNNMGIAFKNLGKLDEAIAALRQAIKLRPDYARAYCNLGNTLNDQEKLDEAAAALRYAIQLNPQYADAYYNLGNTLRRQDKNAEAAVHFQRALELKPHNPEAHNNLGIALNSMKKYDEALAAFAQALHQRPGYAAAYHNWGNTLADQGNLAQAISIYEQAITLRPELAEPYYSMAVTLKDLGRLDESEAACRKALELKPDYPSASWLIAVIWLLRGDYARGWSQAEWRLKCKEFPSPPRGWSQPQWAGQDLAGRTILLHAEQGFGDTVQFVRYAPLVAARGGKVVLECQPMLQSLLKNLPGIAEVVAAGTPLPAFDVHSPLLSLPLAFGTRMDSVPNQVPYLTPDAKLLESWGELLADSSHGLRVGLAWAGSPTHQNDKSRTLKLKQLAPLAAADVKFYSLQKGPAACEVADESTGFRLIDLTARFADFAETAAMIAHLDLVITVDTVIAHLAGALGKPVWVLLPYVPDWRWMLKREDTPWYPTMRLFRQSVQGEWDEPISRVAKCLKASGKSE